MGPPVALCPSMKLLIQIPCFNEAELLPVTLREIPRRVHGVERVEILVIDDGSTDATADIARAAGVDHILRFPVHRGLARAFSAGLDRCLKLGADFIVNLDADNQYDPGDIPRLLEPLLLGEADVVIGERDMRTADHFSATKKALQRIGSWVVRKLSGTRVGDATSGFRAFTRGAALRINVVSEFTYTLETILQAGTIDLAVAGVPVRCRPVQRKSRLFSSIPTYLRKSASTLLRTSALYRPVRVFSTAGLVFLALGGFLMVRFLVLFMDDPSYSGHTQSLVIASIFFTLSFLMGMAGLVAFLISINRRLLEDLLVRVKELEARLAADPEADCRSPIPAGSNGDRPAIDDYLPPDHFRADQPGR